MSTITVTQYFSEAWAPQLSKHMGRAPHNNHKITLSLTFECTSSTFQWLPNCEHVRMALSFEKAFVAFEAVEALEPDEAFEASKTFEAF